MNLTGRHSVKNVIYNWFFNVTGEQFSEAIKGENGVKSILFHEHGRYCEIHYEDGREEWIYNINKVVYK